MSWFTRKPKTTQETYVQAGTAVVVHLYKRLGLSPDEQAYYTQEETKALADFQDAFIAWGKRQTPPLFAFNDRGDVFCIPGLESASLSLKGFIISTGLQNLYRSDAYKIKGAQEKLATALRSWMSYMDSSVLDDMIPMLRELGWEDEVDRVSQVLHRFPSYDSNNRFLGLCKSLTVLEKDPPPTGSK
jgi:hypothetical protein